MGGTRADAGAAPVPGMRGRVLATIAGSSGPIDARAVADALALHVTTVRFHLEQLEAAGLVRRQPDALKRRGRPRVLYRPAGIVRVDDARGRLIDVLAATLDGREDAAALSRQAGERWAERVASSDLVEVLETIGFEPEEKGDTISLRSCPFRDAAREHPGVVCSVHRGLIDRVLAESGSGVRGELLPFVEPELCVVRLTPRTR